MTRKSVLCVVCVLFMLVSLGITTISAQAEENVVLAHWKLQNESGCYTGNVDTDNLTFTDLSGNGNHLQVGIEGNGADLDIFSWDKGCKRNLNKTDSKTSLKFDNSLIKAQSVDPYDSAQTAYSGAYVSGKYLHTVNNAPLNSFNGKDGWTIEVYFKVSPDWSNVYNRYTGIFSRQGVVKERDEPALSLAMAGGVNLEGDMQLLGKAGRVGLQYVFVDAQKNVTNKEFANGQLKADDWYHYMITSKDGIATVYINGREWEKINLHVEEHFMVDDSFAWEVGVGRKLKGNEATMNEEHPEGLIRRLFCGSISEIRFSSGALSIYDSLLFAKDEPTTGTSSTTKSSTTSTKASSTTTVQTNTSTVATQTTTTTSHTTGQVTSSSTSEPSVTVDANATAASTSSTTLPTVAEKEPDSKPSSLWIVVLVAAVVGVAVAVVLPIVLRKKR